MDTMRAENVFRDGNLGEEGRFLYVIFSSTPFKMGRLIRFFTRNDYNHVSLSIDPTLREIYSFARYYRNTPFYGGFVHERGSRFCCGDKTSQLQICAVPITEEQYLQAKEHLEQMRDHAEEYVYNFLSAALYPLHLRVRLPNAYTCVEFVVDFLCKIGVSPVSEKLRYCSIKELESLLVDHAVYRGVCPLAIEEDDFDLYQPFLQACRLTFGTHARLLKSFVKHKIF